MAGNLTAVFHPLFRTVIRRNAVFLTTIFAGAFAFELSFDTASNKIWDAWNSGRQWKDIKPRYLKQGDEDDE
ncbi:Cytochrome b-c1 complex subunit 9 [Penicillium oxalicum]|uniref:Cytochrome b-c1 complex subunit 9 n=1 Tax=Penicillium oxalicum TaxID=69781 RepID=UPI0020B8C9B8|nr:Cytochrome b-c1 complex subunit 9 [Penicillium oxalicum]KAI2787625.1 Cytochrome b-c1 complex subunit 9 [Penicillium oxalicum]